MTDGDKQQGEELNFHTDMPVGEILRRTRVHYGQTLEQVAVVLRIRASQLEALEQGDISKLPGRVYAIGFVRSYSEYLGLDGDKMVHLFKEQSVGKQKKPDLSFPVPASESKVPNVVIIGSSLFGFLVLVGFIAFLMFPKEPKNGVPPVPETLTKTQLNEAPSLVAQTTAPEAVATEGVETPSGITEGETPAAPPPNTNRIIIEVSDASWVEIKNAQGAAILRQVLKPGDIYLVPNEPGLIMATGNSGGLIIKVDGKEIKPLGGAGEIRRKIALNPETLGKGQ